MDEVTSTLRPGGYWDGLNVVDNPALMVPRVAKARRPSREERLFNIALYAAVKLAQEGIAVTATTLHSENPDVPERLYAELLTSPKFLGALEDRGIQLVTTGGLSPHQMSALAIYFDMTSRLSHAQKLKAAGVTEAVWRGWMRQPAFSAGVNQLAEGILQDAKPVMLQRLAEAADAGEKWAIVFGLEVTGRHDRRDQGVDMNALLLTIFTVLDEENVAAGTMARIAARVKEIIGAGAPLTPRVVPVAGYSTPPEIEEPTL